MPSHKLVPILAPTGPKIPNIWIGCAELNKSNFNDHLRPVCEALQHEAVTISPAHESFETAGTKLAEWAERQPVKAPVFVMVDPYGVAGVPMTLLRRLVEIDRVEVLLTFMVRDTGRFIDEDNYQKPLTELFGADRLSVEEVRTARRERHLAA